MPNRLDACTVWCTSCETYCAPRDVVKPNFCYWCYSGDVDDVEQNFIGPLLLASIGITNTGKVLKKPAKVVKKKPVMKKPAMKKPATLTKNAKVQAKMQAKQTCKKKPAVQTPAATSTSMPTTTVMQAKKKGAPKKDPPPPGYTTESGSEAGGMTSNPGNPYEHA